MSAVAAPAVPSLPASRSILVIAALLLAAAILVGVWIPGGDSFAAGNTAPEVCSFNCLYLP